MKVGQAETQEVSASHLHKEIDLIQNCIGRMANNSFLLKGWSLSLVAVVFALSDKESDRIITFFLIIFLLIGFWILNAYFLRLERMYRALYEVTLERRQAGVFVDRFQLNPNIVAKKVDGLVVTVFSVTLRWFYGLPILAAFLLAIYWAYEGI